MKTVSIHEAENQLSSLINTLERTKEKIIIMKGDNAVAEIIPVIHGNRLEIHDNLKNIRILYDPVKSAESDWNG